MRCNGGPIAVMDLKERVLIVVTIFGSQPLISESWMTANRCVRVGDNAFLLFDRITIERAREKFIGLVGPNAKVNAFPVGYPFLYQENRILETGLDRLFGMAK